MNAISQCIKDIQQIKNSTANFYFIHMVIIRTKNHSNDSSTLFCIKINTFSAQLFYSKQQEHDYDIFISNNNYITSENTILPVYKKERKLISIFQHIYKISVGL